MKNQKGITLVALIMTIIIMLILVGVTISVSLNGGLFTKANDAATQTQVAAEKETLLSAALGAYDAATGMVDFTELDSTITDLGFTGSNGRYTNTDSGNIYAVNAETLAITATE